MRIIISPAKKMNEDRDSLPCRELPVFVHRAEELADRLQAMTFPELKKLWKCNDQIAELNLRRLSAMDLRRGLTPAILAYEGIQYQYMAPNVFTAEELEYVQRHLRILSGFYGVLRPFDGVTPYRLEMQARLAMGEEKDLYGYWGGRIAEEVCRGTDCVVDLASKEYGRCVSAHLPEDVRYVSCSFAQRIDGKLVEKGTMCKMARGAMVRFLTERQARQPEELRDFRELGFCHSLADSTPERYVFIRP